MKVDIIKKVQDTVQSTDQKYNMFKGVKRAVIAFSSGPDSVCLLDALFNLYHDKIDFHLVYVNHGLRPQENLRKEEALTKKYALKYNIKYKIIYLKILRTNLGIEGTARQMRHKALCKYLRRIRGQVIALGHNLDDVVETFFMNLIRGSGARGLRSIPAKRQPFVRPLINLKKTEIMKYLGSKRLDYSLDETNRLLDYRRNLLRHKIIPKFLKINPELHQVIERTIDIIRQDDEFLEGQARKAYEKVAERKSGHISLDTKKLLKYNPAVQNRVVMKAVKDLHGVLDGFESKHITQILGLKDKESGKKIHLPKKLYAQKEYNKVIVGIPKLRKQIEIAVDTERDFLVIGDLLVKIRTETQFDLSKLKPDCEVFDLDGLEPPLLIRSKRDGDFIVTKIGRKKVKNIFQERKTPLHRRKEIMMLCDKTGILWVIGIARSSRAFIRKSTKKILVVSFAHSN